MRKRAKRSEPERQRGALRRGSTPAHERSTPGHRELAPAVADWSPRAARLILLAILLLAALLRIPYLTSVPPGLNQDEAVNVWNAWCLWKTGTDQHGTPWPIFYYRALGGNSTTLFLYWTIPFTALGGLNVWTARLPSAMAGILAVATTYWVIARLFNRSVGLTAALLLTIVPWHMQLSRWGHEAVLGPLLTVLDLGLLIWAGFPIASAAARPRAGRALLAGAVVGVSCYGYGSIRLFIPLFLATATLVTLPAWLRLLRDRASRGGLAALALGLAVTFGPLVYQHLVDPAGINKHAQYAGFQVWDAEDTALVRLGKVLRRYFEHLGPDFLFVNGDRTEVHHVQGFGVVGWYYSLPLLIGCIVLAVRVPGSYAARVLLVWLVTYPAGDLFYKGSPYIAEDVSTALSMHVLRSSPGLSVLTVIAAVGVVGIWHWLRRGPRLVAWGLGAVGLAVVVVCDARFVHTYVAEYPKQRAVQAGFHVDLVKASAWLRSNLGGVDGVFVTRSGFNTPYIVTLVGLRYDPRQWLEDPKDYITLGEWEHYTRFGRFRFLYNANVTQELRGLQENQREDNILLVVRPNETKRSDPVLTIRNSRGLPPLLVVHERL